MSVRIEPMRINVPEQQLNDLIHRLKNVRWPQYFDGMDWDYGTNTEYLKELVDYWINDYDWRAQEAKFNQYDHYKAKVDDVGVHFIHIPGKGPNPMPLFMMHGYPWSWATLMRIVPMLTDPESYGGKAEDSFTVILPSLCGFCLSDQVPRRGFGFQDHPAVYRQILKELGYDRYGIQGGDWGGIITFPWGHQFPEDLIGIHINYMGIRMRDEIPDDERDPDLIRGFGLFNAPIKPRDPDSLKFWKAAAKFWMDQSGYSHVNMTCPQSFAPLVADSPVGAASWIVEKYHLWSDWKENFEEVFSKDELLNNIMLYWMNNTFGTAIRIYYESHNKPWKVKPGQRIEIPTGVLSFPKDIVPLIKSRVEEYYNVKRFRYMEKGGHFGIFEQAEEYAKELKDFFRPLRNGNDFASTNTKIKSECAVK